MGTTVEWPGLEWEEQTWHPASAPVAGMVGRSDDIVRYRSALPPRIAQLPLSLPSLLVREVDEAATALARLDERLGSRLESFGPVLLRSEAAASSQIENLTASARRIFEAELGAPASVTGGNAQQIAANTRAMQAAIDMADHLSTCAIQRMHEVLLERVPRHTPGRWRDEAVWIGRRSDSPRGADFVAPHHRHIPGLMQDLVEFARRTDGSPLILTAIAHAQFETIHPFSDGNGRVGRALAQAMLRSQGVTRNVAIPVSAGLLADVQGYHAALMAYREGDIAQIVKAFIRASYRAVANVEKLVDELQDVRSQWDQRLKVRKNSNAWRLLDLFITQPVLPAAAAAQQLGVQAPNVYPPLTALEKAGILESANVHKMGPFWRAGEVLGAIDRFAERAGRREKAS